MRCVIACLLFVLVGLSLAVSSAQETGKKDLKPRFNKVGGKTLEQWLADISSPDRSKGETALSAIHHWPAAEIYRAGGAKIILEELGKHRPPNAFIDVSMRVNLSLAIGNVLGGTLASKEVTVDAKELKFAVDRLTVLLSDTQLIVKLRAIEALGRIGPAANIDKTVDLIIALLDNLNTWEIRQAAAIALGSITKDVKKGPPKKVLDALEDATIEWVKGSQGEPASAVRLAAVQALVRLEAPASMVSAKLLNRLETAGTKDSDASVRVWAQVAMMPLEGGMTDRRLSAISAVLKENTDQGPRLHAAQALAVLAKKDATRAKSQLPALIGCLKDSDPVVVAACIFATAHFKEAAAPALPALTALKNDMNLPEPVRRAASQAIDVINSKK